MDKEQIEKMRLARLASKGSPKKPIALNPLLLDKDGIERTLSDIRRHTPTFEGVFLKAFSGKSKNAAIKAACID